MVHKVAWPPWSMTNWYIVQRRVFLGQIFSFFFLFRSDRDVVFIHLPTVLTESNNFSFGNIIPHKYLDLVPCSLSGKGSWGTEPQDMTVTACHKMYLDRFFLTIGGYCLTLLNTINSAYLYNSRYLLFSKRRSNTPFKFSSWLVIS